MKKRNLIILLVLLVSMTSNKSFAYDIEVKNADGITVYYNFINNSTELEVAYCSGNYGALYSSFHLDIPEKLEYKNKEYPVTRIGTNAFFICSMLKSIVLSDSIEVIGHAAFYMCDQLSSVILPKGLKEIGSEAFEDCWSLSSIEIPIGLKEIGSNAFFNCGSLSSIKIPGSVLSIGDGAFRKCYNLSSLDIQKGVNSIGKGAFLDTNLETVTIPNSVTEIGDGAFTGVTNIYLEDGFINYELRKDYKVLVEISTRKIISSCKDATIIPDDITNLGDYSYYNNQFITSIQIPNKVVSIGSYTFANSSLNIVKIPDSITDIGSGAFSGCSLSSIAIPNNITAIESYTFENCPLSSIVIGKGVKQINWQAFDHDIIPATAVVYLLSNVPPKYSTSKFKDNHLRWMEIHVPNGSKTAYQNDPEWGRFSNIMEFNPETFNPETMSEGEPILLSINHANNGRIIMEINNGEKYKFKAESENGWRVHAITFNGDNVTNQLDDKGFYTTPVLTENSTLCISFEETGGATISSATMSNIKIYAQDNTLIVKGTETGEMITIYDFEGKMIKTVQANNGTTEIPLPTNQTYIVKTSSKIVKVRL